jgi:flagellar biosynthetic protein FliO
VGSSLLAIGGSLLLVIALAVVLGWLVKRLGVKRLIQAKGNYLEVIESVPLGFKRQASLLRIGDIVVVVGVGEQELVTLATLPASTVLREPPAALKPAAETSSVPPAMAAPDPAFRVLLNKVIKG